MAYGAGTIANYFLQKGLESAIPITHLKLQIKKRPALASR